MRVPADFLPRIPGGDIISRTRLLNWALTDMKSIAEAQAVFHTVVAGWVGVSAVPRNQRVAPMSAASRLIHSPNYKHIFYKGTGFGHTNCSIGH